VAGAKGYPVTLEPCSLEQSSRAWLGWKQKWRGPVPGGWPTRGGALGVRCPVWGSHVHWQMALGPPRVSMWGTKATVLEGAVWIAWAPMAVANPAMGGGPPTAPSCPTGWTAAWAP